LPRIQARAEIIPALTGYIDDQEIERVRLFARPFGERSIDVGYRARDLPPQFGRHSRVKAELGKRFAAAAHARGRSLRIDTSNRPEDMLFGDRWLELLGDSRFTLGCEGGSSVVDPRGHIVDAISAYVAEHPNASYEDVEAACFQGQNRTPPLSAVSPRLFEVAAARSAQILVCAAYLPELIPGEHYLSLEPDHSNAEAVLDALSDWASAERMADAFYEAVIAGPRYRYSTHAREVIAKIEEKVAAKGLVPRPAWESMRLVEEHNDTIRKTYRARETRAAYASEEAPLVHPKIRAMVPRPLLDGGRPVVRAVKRWLAGRGSK
jgi:hypothetical protein